MCLLAILPTITQAENSANVQPSLEGLFFPIMVLLIIYLIFKKNPKPNNIPKMSENYIPQVLDCNCPQCNSSEWKLASLIYKSGLSNIDTVTNTISSGIGITSGGHVEFGVIGSDSKTSGRQQSHFSMLAKPPKEPKKLSIPWFILGLYIVYSLYIFSFLGDIFGNNYSEIIINLAQGVYWLAAIYVFFFISIKLSKKYKKHNNQLQKDYSNNFSKWMRTRVCQRCGHFYLPESSSINQDNYFNISNLKTKITKSLQNGADYKSIAFSFNHQKIRIPEEFNAFSVWSQELIQIIDGKQDKKIHTHYDKLRIPRNATNEEIEVAYQAFLKKYNLSNFEGAKKEQILKAHLTAKQCYETLICPEKRKEYDNYLAQHVTAELNKNNILNENNQTRNDDQIKILYDFILKRPLIFLIIISLIIWIVIVLWWTNQTTVKNSEYQSGITKKLSNEAIINTYTENDKKNNISTFQPNNEIEEKHSNEVQIIRYRESDESKKNSIQSNIVKNPIEKGRHIKISNIGKLLPSSAQFGANEDDWACTKDSKTGLIWEIKTDDKGFRDTNWNYSWYEPDPNKNGGFSGYKNGRADIGTGGDCLTKDNCNTFDFVSQVNKIGLCGYQDWRMPTRDELIGLLHCETGQNNSPKTESEFNRICPDEAVKNSPNIDKDYFPNTASNYWSSTITSDPWIVVFSYGGANADNKYFDSPVRLVRADKEKLSNKEKDKILVNHIKNNSQMTMGDSLYEDSIKITHFELVSIAAYFVGFVGGNGWEERMVGLLDSNVIGPVEIGAKNGFSYENIKLNGNIVVLNGKTVGDNDATCCPTVPMVKNFEISTNGFKEIN
jgi:curved DNA-binding protein CbpA